MRRSAQRSGASAWTPSSSRPKRISFVLSFGSRRCAVCGAPRCARSRGRWPDARDWFLFMNFLWPGNLFLVLVVPALLAAYIWAQRRRQKYALRYASLSLVREALGNGPGRKRHIPPALVLIALLFMAPGAAR